MGRISQRAAARNVGRASAGFSRRFPRPMRYHGRIASHSFRSAAMRRCLVAVVVVVGGLAGPAQEPAGKKVALLVGVNRYDKNEFADLTYAERDVTELDAELKAV